METWVGDDLKRSSAKKYCFKWIASNNFIIITKGNHGSTNQIHFGYVQNSLLFLAITIINHMLIYMYIHTYTHTITNHVYINVGRIGRYRPVYIKPRVP